MKITYSYGVIGGHPLQSSYEEAITVEATRLGNRVNTSCCGRKEVCLHHLP